MGGLAVSFKIGKCRGNSKFSKVLLFSLFGFVFAFYRNVQLAYQFKLLEWDIDDNLRVVIIEGVLALTRGMPPF